MDDIQSIDGKVLLVFVGCVISVGYLSGLVVEIELGGQLCSACCIFQFVCVLSVLFLLMMRRFVSRGC